MVGELAEYLGVTASTMSLTLKRLDEAGLIRRDRDPADRRVVNVRLTEDGRAGPRRPHPARPGAHRTDARAAVPPERQAALRGAALLADAADALVRRRREDEDAQLGV